MITISLKKWTGLFRKFCSRSSPKDSNFYRKPGISALVLLRNEPFVEPSLSSIKDIVNEFIVVDSSTDNTGQKIRQLAKEHGLNLKYVHMEMNYQKQMETAIKLSNCEWLLKWDGDFIAYHSGDRDIIKLKNISTSLPQEKYFFIEFSVLNIELDLLRITRNPYHLEAYLFKYSPQLIKKSFSRILRNHFRLFMGKKLFRSPHLPFPLWYDRITLNRVFAIHLRSVKSPLRILERKYQTDWALLNNKTKQKFSNTFGDFLKYCVKREFNKDFDKDKEEVAQIYIKQLMKERNLMPYDTNIHGDYPVILKRTIKDTLDTEINQTQEFKNKITSFLLEEKKFRIYS